MHTSDDSLTAPIEEVIDGKLAAPKDKTLVLAFKRGEEGSYQAIYERYSGRVRGICRRMLDDSHDAEEAQQETFMRVFTSLPNFNGRYQLGAWMSRIATNICLDHIRSTSRKPADSTDHIELVDLSTESDDGPEEVFFQGDERQRVRKVLSQLAPTHRAALALREFEGMSYAEIAIALRMTEAQVKALIHRARRSFKKQWAPGLAFLLPWKLLARLRRFSHHYDAPPQIADAAASTANFASSCSAVLHQCGAFVTDKAAGAFTALVVGTAAVGVAVAPGPVASARNEAKAIRVANVDERTVARGAGRKSEKKDSERNKKPAVVAAPADDPDPVPSSAPAAEEEPPPTSKAPSEETPQEKPPSDPDETSAGPGPTATFFGFASDYAIPRADALSSQTQADCTRRTLHHEVDTLIADGAYSYRMAMVLDAGPTSARFQFSVWKNQREVRYSSWGPEPSLAWVSESDATRLEISGEFGALQGYDTSGAKLPTSGTYDATLTLDCAAQTVVSEGAVFTAQ